MVRGSPLPSRASLPGTGSPLRSTGGMVASTEGLVGNQTTEYSHRLRFSTGLIVTPPRSRRHFRVCRVNTARAKSTYAQYPQARLANMFRYFILMVVLLLDPAAVQLLLAATSAGP